MKILDRWKDRLRVEHPGLFLALRKLRYGVSREAMSPRSARILQSICPGEPVVLAGPFAGMRYLSFASGSGILPKIVGL